MVLLGDVFYFKTLSQKFFIYEVKILCLTKIPLFVWDSIPGSVV